MSTHTIATIVCGMYEYDVAPAEVTNGYVYFVHVYRLGELERTELFHSYMEALLYIACDENICAADIAGGR